MPNLYRYNPDFEPVLLEGMTITLHSSFLPTEGIEAKCIAVAALPEMQNDFGALTGGTWDTDNQWTGLELGSYEFAQVRMQVVDDMYCRIKNPPATTLWRTLRANAWLPQFPFDGTTAEQKHYWKASEFFVWENHTPRFDLYSSISIGTSIVSFSLWKIKVSQLPADQKGAFPLWLDSWPTMK